MAFNESDVNRVSDGTFSEKNGKPSEVSLLPGEIDRGDGIVCQPRELFRRAYCRGCGWKQEFESREEAEAAVESHRVDPGYESVVIKENKFYTLNTFMKDGVIHRVGAPAVRTSNQSPGQGTYYENGEMHRTDGPAYFIGELDESNEWWLRGKQIELSEDEAYDIEAELDSVFDLMNAKFGEEEHGITREDALSRMKRIVRERVLNERISAYRTA